MAETKHPGPWHHQDLDSGSVVDANGVVVIEDFRVPQFLDENDDRTQEAAEIARLVLAAPESFALVVEMLTVVLPEMTGPREDVLIDIDDFRARCRRLVTRVLAQPAPPSQPPEQEPHV
jgi:hypothetical protein